MKFTIEKINLPLKVNWKLSRNATNEKTNLIIKLKADPLIMGEVAPNIRYGETPDSILNQFYEYFSEDFSHESEVREVMSNQKIFHSLKFGIDQVLLKHRAWQEKTTLEKMLQLAPTKPVATSYSIPIMPISEIKDYLDQCSEFRHLKLKVDSESALDLVTEVCKFFKGQLRVDANEGWTSASEFMNFQEKIRHLPIEFIEQPFPSAMADAYKEIFSQVHFPIMADESIEDSADFSQLSRMFHMINIKLMKTGTIENALNLIKEARKYKMKVMFGCMIETSLGISSALRLSSTADFFDLDGFLLLKEDPFKLIELEGDMLRLKN